MNYNKVPECVLELIRDLENKWGFALVEPDLDKALREGILHFKLAQFALLILREIDHQWQVVCFEETRPKGRYYTSLFKDIVDNNKRERELNIDEESKFWRTRWPEVRAYFERDPDAAHEELKRLMMENFKKRFPGKKKTN